ncbi:MAG: putative membrane protein [Pseudidiomarina mangrovi]|nr:MAG: putative membrane protein [Pseudidiomarina mangrovi]
MGYSRFRRYWQAAFVRHHEAHHGLLEPYAEATEALHQGSFNSRCLQRAERLSAQLGWQQLEQQWHWQRRLLLLGFIILVIVAGSGLTNGLLALTSPISLLHAWFSLVGINLVMLLLWLVAMLRAAPLPGVGGFAIGMSQRWRLFRRTRAMTTAWLQVMQQQRLLSPALSAMSHGFWLALLGTAWLLLLLRLSAQSYSFTWETTILSAQQLQQTALWLGYLPQLMGFDPPPLQALLEQHSAVAQQQAGRWLLAVLWCYGMAPRALLLVIALLTLASRYRQLSLNDDDPAYAAMQRCWQQLASANARIVDADAGQSVAIPAAAAVHGQGRLVLSLDHEPATALPAWAADLTYLGVIATGSDKRRVLEQLGQQAAALVVVRIDVMLSPDRGSIEFLRAVQPLTQRLLLVNSQPEQQHDFNARIVLWQQALQRLGVEFIAPTDMIHQLAEGASS